MIRLMGGTRRKMNSLTSFPPEPEYSAVTTLSMRVMSNSLEKSNRACPSSADRLEYESKSKHRMNVRTSMAGEGSWIESEEKERSKKRSKRVSKLCCQSLGIRCSGAQGADYVIHSHSMLLINQSHFPPKLRVTSDTRANHVGDQRFRWCGPALVAPRLGLKLTFVRLQR